MDTHRDLDLPLEARAALFKSPEELAEQSAKLAQLAKLTTELGLSEITAGKPGETILAEEQVGMIYLCRRPEDPIALRISLGEGHSVADSAYCVFRGDPQDCLELLERVIGALKASHFYI